MTDTRHLDTAIAILKGTAGSKRAKRTAQVEVLVTIWDGKYTIQVNGKLVEEGEGDDAHAMHLACTRAAHANRLGKTSSVTRC